MEINIWLGILNIRNGVVLFLDHRCAVQQAARVEDAEGEQGKKDHRAVESDWGRHQLTDEERPMDLTH